MLALIVLAPLAGAVFNGLFFATGLFGRLRRDRDRLVGTVACGAVLVSALLSTRLFIDLLSQNPTGSQPITAELFTWMVSGTLEISFEFLFDSLSAVMALVVTWVGFLIHVYSIGYMRNDRCYARYFTYLNIFVFFMLVLVLGNNFPMMFVGWEGVGLASYLLIGFWYQDSFRVYAGRKAFVVNRIGDFGFILGILLIFTTFGSLNYQEVFSQFGGDALIPVSQHVITAIALLLFIGAVGKSAQFPLHVWLPDAMAGPTAVSALIHAATMVTAGVYMVSRCSVFFTASPVASDVVLITATFTAFFAATIAITQNDIKKVLAYSTVSQLGYMLMAAGAGAYIVSIFHLITHAFFKALLFLGAGSVIHAMSGEQDIRKMGGLRRMIPVTAFTFLVATLAISGVPILSGFFSKDEILAYLYDGGHTFFWVAGLLTAILTALYMTRLYLLTFEGKARMDYGTKSRIHESPAVMTVPLVILAVLSAAGGLIGVPKFMGEYAGFDYYGLLQNFLSSLEATDYGSAYASSHYFGHWALVGFSVFAAFIGILLGILIYYRTGVKSETEASSGKAAATVRRWSFNKWYVDEIYNNLFVSPFNYISALSSDFDRSVIDRTLDGLANFVRDLSGRIGAFQSGLLRHYAATMVGAAIILIVLLFIYDLFAF